MNAAPRRIPPFCTHHHSHAHAHATPKEEKERAKREKASGNKVAPAPPPVQGTPEAAAAAQHGEAVQTPSGRQVVYGQGAKVIKLPTGSLGVTFDSSSGALMIEEVRKNFQFDLACDGLCWEGAHVIEIKAGNKALKGKSCVKASAEQAAEFLGSTSAFEGRTITVQRSGAPVPQVIDREGNAKKRAEAAAVSNAQKQKQQEKQQQSDPIDDCEGCVC